MVISLADFGCIAHDYDSSPLDQLPSPSRTLLKARPRGARCPRNQQVTSTGTGAVLRVNPGFGNSSTPEQTKGPSLRSHEIGSRMPVAPRFWRGKNTGRTCPSSGREQSAGDPGSQAASERVASDYNYGIPLLGLTHGSSR